MRIGHIAWLCIVVTACAPSEQTKTFTETQFRQFAVGKSMAQLRDALGEPDAVTDAGGTAEWTWFYWKRHVAITDPDSGRNPTSANVYFDAGKTATDVAF